MKIDELMEQIQIGIDYVNENKRDYKCDYTDFKRAPNEFLISIYDAFNINETSYGIEIAYQMWDQNNNIKNYMQYSFKCCFDYYKKSKMNDLKKDLNAWLKFINRGKNENR